MSGLTKGLLERIRRKPAPVAEPTLRDWVEASLAPPGAEIDEATAARLEALVNRASARELLRGRGPYQHFTRPAVLVDMLRRDRRRKRNRRKAIQQRNRARGLIP